MCFKSLPQFLPNKCVLIFFFSMYSIGEKILDWIACYVPLGTIPFIILGNLLTFTVFSMKNNRASLTSLLYRVLAVTQTLYLMIESLHYLPMMIVKSSLFTYNLATCKVFAFMQMWLRALLAWILNLIALERLIGIVFPLRTPALNRKRYYRRLFLGISLFLFVLYGPLLIIIGREEVFEQEQPQPLEDTLCVWGTFNETLTWYSYGLFNWSNLVMASLLPFAILITFNAAVIWTLIASRRAIASSISSNAHPGTSNSQIAVLVSISLTFIVMSLPYPLYVIFDHYYVERVRYIDELTETPFDLEILTTIGPVCDSVSASLTIVFHCLFGKRFRQSLKKILCCKWPKRWTSNIMIFEIIAINRPQEHFSHTKYSDVSWTPWRLESTLETWFFVWKFISTITR